jgi:hypothetical protein
MGALILILSLFGVVFVSVMMGSREFGTGRTIIVHPGRFAAAITAVILIVMLLTALSGR